MRKKFLQIVLILITLCQTAAYAQTSGLKGRVIGTDNEPVAGASVTISGTSIGTVTDAEGNFTLQVPPGASLLINSIGFSDQIVKVDGRSSVNVQLSAGQSSGLDEVVVTGYTSQRKKDIVGSVAIVDVKALQAIPSGSALQALQGQASGLDIVNSGSPGAPSSIFIRGIASINGGTPLVLIDGIQGEINDVPANDVASIQVLKDAGAASIYGSRGSNGVIVITTKRGKSGKTKINYNSYYNYQVPFSNSKLNIMSPSEYSNFYKNLNPASNLYINGELGDFMYRQGVAGPRGVANAGDPLVDPAKYKLDLRNPENSYIISKTNKNNNSENVWDALFNPALMMNHTLTASGGTDRSNYLFSLGYLDQQGTLINTYLKRYNARINTQFAVTKNIRIGENINVYFRNNPQAAANGNFGPIQTAMNNIPIIPIRDIQGNFAGDFAGPGAGELGDWGNAVADASLVGNNRNRDWNVVGNAFIEADILKHFTARASLGGNVANNYNQFYQPKPYWRRNGNADDRLTESSGFGSLLQWTGTLSYRNTWGKHNLSVLAGVETVENEGRRMELIADAFYDPSYEYVTPNTGVVQPLRNGIYDNNRANAYSNSLYSKIGRIDYSYNDRYLLGFTIRDDAFSGFGPEKKHGTFPALALGWRLSQENFMKNVYWINDLKIRGSYGILGNKEPIQQSNQYSTYRQDRRYSYYNMNGDGSTLSSGFFPAQYGNTRTSWEENKLYNIGLDAVLFKNKLDFSAEYYVKRVNGLLQAPTLPATGGEGNPANINVGDIQNKGVDLNVNYRTQISKDVLFTIGANLTHYKNKVISLPEPGYYDVDKYRVESGYPISSFFGYKVIGLFNDTNQVKASPFQADAGPGRYRYLDTDGNDTINTKDRMHLGDADPSFTLGINLGLNYKNFDFAAQIYTVQGLTVNNATYDYIGSPGVAGNKSRMLLDAWTPANTNTRIRVNETATNFSTGANIATSQWLEDASFARLRLVQVGYTFKSGDLRRAGVSNLRLFLQGTNLITLTKYSGLDPEVVLPGAVQRGLDAGAYVPQRGFVFGVDLTF